MATLTPSTEDPRRVTPRSRAPLADQIGVPQRPPDVWEEEEIGQWPPPTPRRKRRGGVSGPVTLLLLGATVAVSVAAGVITGRRLAQETVAYFPGGPVSTVMETLGLKEGEKTESRKRWRREAEPSPREEGKSSPGFLESIAQPRYSPGEGEGAEPSRPSESVSQRAETAKETFSSTVQTTRPPAARPPAPAPKTEEFLTVATANLNVRRGPATTHAALTKLAEGAKVTGLEQVKGAEKEYPCWYRVRLEDGRTGYVACDFVK